MLDWGDLDLSVREDVVEVPRSSRPSSDKPRRSKKTKVVKKQEVRITKSTPIPQTVTDKSTIPDDKIVGSNKGAMPVIPIMEGESGADGEETKKETIVLPNLMNPTPEPKKVVDPKEWASPIYKDTTVVLTILGVIAGVLIAKKINKAEIIGGMIGAVVGIAAASLVDYSRQKSSIEPKDK